MEKFDLEPMDEESKILIQHIERTFQIDTVEPVYFINIIAGHEIMTYNAKKLYLAKRIVLSDNLDSINLGYGEFYDENNIVRFQITNNSVYWDSLLNQIHYITNYFSLKNILFSKFIASQYNRFYMIGYRITLQ